MIWSKDSNEWPGISLPLIVPGDLEIFKAISLFNMTNAFAIVSARLGSIANCPPSLFSCSPLLEQQCCEMPQVLFLSK